MAHQRRMDVPVRAWQRGGFSLPCTSDWVVEICRPFQRGGVVWGDDFLGGRCGSRLDFPGDERTARTEELTLFHGRNWTTSRGPLSPSLCGVQHCFSDAFGG